MLRICSCFVLAFILALPAAAAPFTGRVHVIDGDTIDVGQTRVRLFGIDAPERDQPCTSKDGQAWGCGDWVTRQVRDRYTDAQAVCTALDRDRYGRVVARCTVAGEDMARRLVQEGWAFAYREYSMDYDLDEKRAVVTARGIHAYDIQAPSRYRLTGGTAQRVPDAQCQIKGNISAKGTRIYHMPGQAFYSRTRISEAKGERWFCSEAQARASGWRKARR